MNLMKRVCAMMLAVMLMLTIVPSHVSAQESDDADLLVYNCGSREITIGWSTLGDSSANPDQTFNEDGSYTIQLEKDAFFPYEIQFQYNGQTTVEVFESLDSTAKVGGHEIRVAAEYSEDAISQIGVYIGGKYVAAKPEPKTFTQTPGPQPRSLLPLERKSVWLDLTDFSIKELETVQVSAIIGAINAEIDPDIPAGAQVLWNYVFDEEGDRMDRETFRPIGNQTVDLSGSNYLPIVMIVGTENQLEPSNKRYHIGINMVGLPKLEIQLYAQDDIGLRNKIASDNMYLSSNSENNLYRYYLDVMAGYLPEAEYYFNITHNMPETTIKLYSGLFKTQQEALAVPGADITSQAVNQDMENAGTGHKANYSAKQPFTLFCIQNDEVVLMKRFYVEAGSAQPSVSVLGLYSQGEDGALYRVNDYPIYSSVINGVRVSNITLRDDYIKDNSYYSLFEFKIGSETDNSKVTKAVQGHYNSLQEAASQMDIKAQLLAEDLSSGLQPDSGYLANYAEGVDFTFFTEDGVYRYTVFAQDNPASSDTYLDITGAVGANGEPYGNQTVYKVLSKDDSGAEQFGYQILMIDDESANLAALKPTFTTGTGLSAYVDGKKQISEENIHDFSNGPLQYSARAENGRNVKNYWVSFIKAVKGAAKLFVVVDGEKPGEREVFLDSFTGKHHDIFLANLGDAPLTGLKVELKDAHNVKLDEYWKVGGPGNDTLDGFDKATENNYYGEMSNIAKVRLLPDGYGEVGGTLVISSDNGGSYTLTLKGQAGNPSIITKQVDTAVKYVPYSFLIQTNNKYDWNEVTFRLTGGKLPEGVTLRPSGELYGAPTETGTFTFRVQAQYSYADFQDSEAEFTMTVLENTDKNVADQVDTGYTILDYVPRYVSASQDQLFRSEGSFNEFVDFWLDGNRLIRNQDYTAESGSTAITIRAQTFQKYGSGTHTIAAEFRVDGDESKQLKRAAQNYSLDLNNGSSDKGTSESSNSNVTSGAAASNPVAAAKLAAKKSDQKLSQLIVGLKNINYVSLAEFKEMAGIAAKEGKTPWLDVDTLMPRRNSVDVRIGLNPALVEDGMYMAASTQNAAAKKTRNLFKKYFANSLPAVISLSQQQDFGQTATLCVQVPKATELDNLVYYAYNRSSNTYRQIMQPKGWMDINGYLHFDSPYGGDIIISDGELGRRPD